jgi:hypothetical protein
VTIEILVALASASGQVADLISRNKNTQAAAELATTGLTLIGLWRREGIVTMR